MTLLPRLRAVAPNVHWEAALPARVGASEAPRATLERIHRRVAIELDGVGEVVVLLNDESRVVDAEVVTAVLAAVRGAPRSVKVLFARGSHPLPTPDAHLDATFAGLSGDERRSLAVEHHDARRSPFVEVAGVPLHRSVAEAERIVALGSVEPHYFAGWTGAHKTATIGVMGREGIEANHEHALEPGSRVLALDGNPVFEGVASVANALDARLLCVNTVLVEGQRIAWGVGRWRSALDQVVPEAMVAFAREVEAPFDILVAAVEGPLARNLYQAEKGVKNSESVVADGGAVVLHAACAGGLGQDRFIALLEAAKTHEAALAKVRDEGYVLGDHKAVKVRALEARGVTWHLACPGISASPEAAERVRNAGLALYSSLEEAVAAACRGGERRRGLVVHDAANIVARAR